ncbi:MAG: hypothetical protein HQL33_01890 [Alphaproteobacteria bacterium]|nr:hypothetical protein [Alphaproteobacteria bacterium]
MNGMPKALIAPAVMAASLLISCTTLPGSAAARTGADGTCTSLMVLADDADMKIMDSDSSVSQQVDESIRENFARYRNYVVTRSAMRAHKRFGLKTGSMSRMSEADHISLMNDIKEEAAAGASEFDVRFLVFYRLYPLPYEKGIERDTQEIQISGYVYDADAKRHIGNFGPKTERVVYTADCAEKKGVDKMRCTTAAVREKAADFALTITNGARNKLMLITPECMEEPRSPKKSSQKGEGTTGIVDPPTKPDSETTRRREPLKLTTTYTVQFRHFTPTQFLAIKAAMDKEFPDFVQAGRVSGSAPIVSYGYTTQAPQEKIHEWLHMVLKDSDISPDLDATISASGTTFKVEYLGSDLPEAPRRRKYDY